MIGAAVWLALLALASSARARLRTPLARHNAAYRLRLNNFNNVQYSASFSLGEQTLPVIYDTGSFEIIVLSTLCHSCSGTQTVYDSSKSPSFVSADGVVAEHLFGSGDVRSEQGYEQVHFGGQDSPYSVQKLSFWQVLSHNIAVWNDDAHFSGIVGLGHPDRVPKDFSALADNPESMLSRMQIESFAMCLERGVSGAPGWLALGSSVASVGSTFKTLNVVGQVHWGVKLTGLTIPGISTIGFCSPSCAAIVDSGTSLIAVPPSAHRLVEDLEARINRDCSNIYQLPVLRMTLDTVEIELPPAAYVMQVRAPVYGNSTIWHTLTGRTRSKTAWECSAAFMTIDKESQFGPVWILGMPFLRYYYSVFNRVSKKIHIAKSTPGCAVAPEVGRFVNTSSLGGISSQTSSSTRAFASADFKPTQANLNDARIPGWAISAARHLHL